MQRRHLSALVAATALLGVRGVVAAVKAVSVGDARRIVTGTTKALDGLYLILGEEEKKIRRDPVGTGSALLAKVFGG